MKYVVTDHSNAVAGSAKTRKDALVYVASAFPAIPPVTITNTRTGKVETWTYERWHKYNNRQKRKTHATT